LNKETRIAMEKHYLGETPEERKNRFYYIMKIMNECGEVEFLHALSSICIERYHEEDFLLDQSRKRNWFIMSKLSSVLKSKLLEQNPQNYK